MNPPIPSFSYHPEVGLAVVVLPLLVQLPGVVRLERLLPEAHLDGELGGQLAHQQRVPRVVQYGARHGRGALHAAQAADGADVLRLSVERRRLAGELAKACMYMSYVSGEIRHFMKCLGIPWKACKA